MNYISHKIYISTMALIVLGVLAFLIYYGYSFYNTSVETRFFHPDYNTLKPSGIYGHGLGIIGSLLMIIGVTLYMVRKRSKMLRRVGLLKHWLEFHIFLCTLGPILILFHTSYKFGGIVSISFWSMVAVFLSGIIGRFIYIQIPRTIEGRELSLDEVKGMKADIEGILSKSQNLDETSAKLILKSTRKPVEIYHSSAIYRFYLKKQQNRKTISEIKKALKNSKISEAEYKQIMKLIYTEISLNSRIDRLDTMKNLFKYWHVAHLPFAIVMITIMIIHIAITITFGYKWIF